MVYVCDMADKETVQSKADFGKAIRALMGRLGIKSAKELTDTINREAGEKIVSETSVGKWLAGKTVPKATSLMFLAKALKVSADLILFDEDSDEGRRKSLRHIVAEVAQEEIGRILSDKKIISQKDLSLFLGSSKIPDEDKQSILRQIRNLLKMYEREES